MAFEPQMVSDPELREKTLEFLNQRVDNHRICIEKKKNQIEKLTRSPPSDSIKRNLEDRASRDSRSGYSKARGKEASLRHACYKRIDVLHDAMTQWKHERARFLRMCEEYDERHGTTVMDVRIEQ